MTNSATNHIDPVFFNFTLEYLQRFFPVSAEQAAIMIGYCELRSFEKKKIVVEEGEIENYLNLVISGLVRKYVRKGKNEVTLQLATEGHIIHSEISFLRQVPSPVVVETIEPATLVSLSYQNYEQALAHLPGVDHMARMLLTAMYIKKDERQYKQMQLTTRERFLEYINTHSHMLQRVPQKYLASYLNIKPETFSRLKHLVRNKQP